jgi:Tfp pilus assembly protein PilO
VILWKRPRVFDVDAAGAGAVALLLLLGVTLVWRPMWSTVKSLPQWRDACDRAGRDLLAERHAERNLREKVQGLREELDLNGRGLRERQALDAYLQDVSETCRRHQVQIDEVHPAMDVSLGSCVMVSVSYRGQSSWACFAAFLADLEESTQFLDVYGLAIRNEQPGTSGPYTVEWTLRAFFRRPQPAQGVADAR